MWCNIYVTDFGEVRISEREREILQCADDARRELAGSPFLESAPARRLLAKADSIKAACVRVAYSKNFQDFK